MPLVELDLFAPVFGPLEGREVGFLPLDGNVGDWLIDEAAKQLMGEFGVRYRVVTYPELDAGELKRPVERILISGGGNLGGMYPVTREQRLKALRFGVPVHILPQSYTDPHEDTSRFQRVFVRERTSLGMNPSADLAPDLALGHRDPWVDEGVEAGIGVWLREDGERRVVDRGLSLGDPITRAANVDEYLGLASKFEHIVTDRLHFAIAGLLVNRRVTLLPNSYHKNRSMYETWLRDIGCRWRWSLDGFKPASAAVPEHMWRRISAPPSALVPWNGRPRLHQAWTMETGSKEGALKSSEGQPLQIDRQEEFILSLCHGEYAVEDMVLSLAERFEIPVMSAASRVQDVVGDYLKRKVLVAKADPGTAPGGKLPRNRRFIDVEILSARRKRGWLRWAAHVRNTSKGDYLQYFEVESRFGKFITPRADAFVLALLPRAMIDGVDLRVRGAAVDARLLDSLDEYQQVWQHWRPASLRSVAIDAKEVAVADRYHRPAVTLFSGGLDSTYTLFRHRFEDDGRRNRRLDAAVMVRGFDISVHDRRGFAAGVARLRPVVEEAGVELIQVVTNVRTGIGNWELEHGTALASVMTLLSRHFGTGLIPATAPYRNLFPWGTNPITDRLLGGAFHIEHDSAAVLRLEKLRALTRWPGALSRLRVCWRNRDVSANCGRCTKCFHLAMGLQALRAPLSCFPAPPGPRAIADYVAVCMPGHWEKIDFSCVLAEAISSGVDEPWVAALSERFPLRGKV